MADYDIILRTDGGDATESVAADAYRQEGPMTTFFELDPQRRVIDCWAVRVASFRTTDIVAVRRVDVPRRHRGTLRHDCDATRTALT